MALTFTLARDEGAAAEAQAVVDAGDDLVVFGDAVQGLAVVPDGTARTAVCSPPYWSLRDYDHEGQIGCAEPLPLYIKSLVSVFDVLWDKLEVDGTAWVNIGDSYTSGKRGYRAPDKKNPARAMARRPPNPDGVKDKELIGVPWMFASAMRAAGWYVRSEVVWYKPNCQPESVKDRPTRSHEIVFLFSKTERYFYNVDGARGPNGRQMRDMWEINTVAYPGAHDAVYPPELVERCLKLTSAPGDYVLDPFLGSGTTGAVARQLGRSFVGCELDDRNLPLIAERVGA